MKRGGKKRNVAAICGAVAVISATQVLAQTWDGGGTNNNWSTASNWSPNTSPVNDGSAAILFSGGTRTTPNLDSNRSIASLDFDNSTASFTLGSSTGSVLTIGSGGIGNQDNLAHTIDHNIALSASQSWSAALGNIVVNGNVNLGTRILTATGAFDDVIINGVISGSGGIIKTGDSADLFMGGSSANTYTGGTIVNGGDLFLSKSVTNGAILGNLIIGDGSGTDRVVLQQNSQIASPSIEINSSGVLDLNGFFDTVNDVTLNGGHINIPSGGLEFSLQGDITTLASSITATITGNGEIQIPSNQNNNNDFTVFNIADGAAAIDLDVEVAITHTVAAGGLFIKSGAGTMRLGEGVSSQSRWAAINGGTLIFTENFSLGSEILFGFGGYVFVNGEIDDFAMGSGGGTLKAGASIVDACDITVIDGGFGIFDTAGFDLQIDGLSSRGPGSAAPLTKIGAGKLIVTKDAGINGVYGGTFTVSGGTLQLGNGGTAGNISGDIVNNANLIFNRSNSFNYNGVISGSGTIEKLGAGTVNLTANNTFNGVTTISQGALQFGGLSGNIGGTIVNNASLIFGRSNDQSSLHVIIGSGSVTKIGSSTLTVAAGASWTYDGPTFINAGTMLLQLSNRLPNNSAFTVASGATLDLANQSDTIGSLAGAGTVLIDGGALTTGGDGTSTTFSGVLSGSGSLTKTGAGTMRIGGAVANSLTGATTVSGGTLELASTVSDGAVVGSLVVGDGNGGAGADVVRLMGINQVANTAAVTINASGLLDLNTFRDSLAAITMTRGAIDTGTNGQLRVLSSVTTLASSGSSTISGAGTVRLTDAASGGAASHTFNVADGTAAIDLEISVPIQDLVGPCTLIKTGAGTLRISGGASHAGGTTVSAGTLEIGGTGTAAYLGDIANSAALVFNYSGDAQYDGDFTGAGTVTKLGSDHLALTGTNSASVTTIAAGALTLGFGGPSTSASLSGDIVINGDFLRVYRSDNLTLAGTISGSGTLIQHGQQTGTLTLTGSNSHNATQVDSGTLVVSSTANLGSDGAFNVLDMRVGTTLRASGPISMSRTVLLANLLSGQQGHTTLDANGHSIEFKGSGGTSISFFSITGGVVTFNRSAGGLIGVAPFSTVTINPGATLNLSGAPVFFDGVDRVDVINNSVASFNVTGGSHDVGNISGTGATNVSAGATLTASHIRQSALTVNGSAIIRSNGTATGVSTVESLVLGGGAGLDLRDNKLIVFDGDIGSWNGSEYTGVTGLVDRGRGNGTWNGSGIVTSMSDATGGVLTTLAVALASDVGYAGGTFAGQSVSAGDVLVMYTWGGDAELDGDLDGDDYFWIDSNVGLSGSVFGFNNGDFDYDGDIDGDDYFMIDSNIAFANTQPDFPTGAGVGGLTAVPEPTGLAAAALAGLGLRRRRRRIFSRSTGG